MRVFYDTEIVERGPQLPLQLISAGFVAEDGRELYVINEECLTNVMRHGWLSVNVAPGLPIRQDQETVGGFITQWDVEHPAYAHVLSLDSLVGRVQDFLLSTPNLELWAYFGAYDHVVLSQLWGSMADLPAGIPMFSHELMQLIEQHPDTPLPSQPDFAHHALLDARWNFDAFNALSMAPLPAPESSLMEATSDAAPTGS